MMLETRLNFIKKNISIINKPNFKISQTLDGQELFGSDSEMKGFLSQFFFNSLISNEKLIHELEQELEDVKFVKSRIVEIANKHNFYFRDLERFLELNIQKEEIQKINSKKLIDNTLEFISSNIDDISKFKFIKKNISSLLQKQFDFLISNGFSNNLLNINSGIMISNAGDSAQFLFVARAILAGFNCSNVDVRSSRYDAVIDINGVVLRIQVKGVSGNSIKFINRNRGGLGNDSTHFRNIGKRITSIDCDVYVAVDKQVGTCYLIPVKDVIDNITDEDIKKSFNVSEFNEYKEAWNILTGVAEKKMYFSNSNPV